jgi:hypothetical protein
VDYVTYFVQVFKVLPYITISRSVHREECITYMTQSAVNDDISVSSLYRYQFRFLSGCYDVQSEDE